ncbi:NAD(P)H-binding protein [Streptomyces sp. H51]|uniref:NAD(P)H-binding protein n=1 Tax=Streptomyces sp. H51 TaxID=3111770 RepID=UPI002D790DB0|nr:NAD(P)H-binding protein [Streptomyces sp. H51]
MTILVTGATGNVGRRVVELLLAAGAPVRATSRNPKTAELAADVDVRAGDLDDPGSFGDALSGVQKLFLFPSPSGVAGFLDLAGASGVRHVVLLSSGAVSGPGESVNPIGLMHLSVEQAVRHSGLAWTVLRPGSFASNTLQWAPAIRESGEVRIPYAESTVSPIHERDIAAVAVQALLSGGHEGATYDLTGPESMTQRRQAELIAAAIGRPVTVVDLAGDAARAQLEEQYGAFAVPGLVDSLLAMYAASVGTAAPVTDTVARITGRAPATFADWASEHRPAFTAA